MVIDLFINDISCETYGFIYLRKDSELPSLKEYGGEWLRNSYRPILSKKKDTYRQEKLYFLCKGDENSFETLISNFINKLKECTLKFSDTDFYYDCEYAGGDKLDKINPKTKEIGLTMRVYCKRKSTVSETANRVSSKTINVSGNLETPVIVEITPSINLVDLTITGFGESFTIKNLTAGQKVVINGEDGTVLQGSANKFADWDGWEFPKLSPGANTMTFSKSSCDITIKYKPRWI